MQNKLYVTNIPFQTTEENLAALFAKFGEVVEVIIPTEQNTNRPRGFAFVEFKNEEDAKQALEALHGTIYLNRRLCVRIAEDKDHSKLGRW